MSYYDMDVEETDIPTGMTAAEYIEQQLDEMEEDDEQGV